MTSYGSDLRRRRRLRIPSCLFTCKTAGNRFRSPSPVSARAPPQRGGRFLLGPSVLVNRFFQQRRKTFDRDLFTASVPSGPSRRGAVSTRTAQPCQPLFFALRRSRFRGRPTRPNLPAPPGGGRFLAAPNLPVNRLFRSLEFPADRDVPPRSEPKLLGGEARFLPPHGRRVNPSCEVSLTLPLKSIRPPPPAGTRRVFWVALRSGGLP